VLALTVAELQRLDAGYRWTADGGKTYPYRNQGIIAPALRGVFAALPRAYMNLEMKTRSPGMSATLCALILEHGMENRVVVAAVEQAPMDTFRSAWSRRTPREPPRRWAGWEAWPGGPPATTW